MGDPKGFLKVRKKDAGNRPIKERIYDFSEVEQVLNSEDRKLQASRCMDCGIPFCHWGCPVDNLIPEWNDMLYKGEWKKAAKLLLSTNNFPEFTGRICPAPCEHSCVLTINGEPVTIRENEVAIIEHAFAEGFIKPEPPKSRNGKKVAVIGSGPAGMACADLLNKWGYQVTLFEKDEFAGGLLRFGIPDFKLAKFVVERRINLMREEGVEVKTNTEVGKDISGKEIMNSYDAVCLAIGAMKPRDLPVPGRELAGVHFAMDYLTQQNRVNSGSVIPVNERITAKDKDVLIIGGGDTGSDCVGTAIRQGAKSVTQIEILPKPPKERSDDNPWPYFAKTLKTTTSHEEGCERRWSLSTVRFEGKEGQLTHTLVQEVDWSENGTPVKKMSVVPGKEELLKTDLVLLAMGFVHPIHEGLINELNLEKNERSNIKITGSYQTNIEKVFSAGDAVTGASLVVRAIKSGRVAAQKIQDYLGVKVPETKLVK
jgi:glutamate synthase (NADPH) small chain